MQAFFRALPSSIKMTDYLLDAGLLPTAVIRQGIRYQLRDRLANLPTTQKAKLDHKLALVKSLRERDIAENTAVANKEHYEVGTDVFELSLGKRLKYSACLYKEGKGVAVGAGGKLSGTLEEAEERMLDLYVQRAQVEDGMRILDLGCGWGSLCLYLAERFPGSKVTALSNSRTQKEFIDKKAADKGLKNLEVVTGDIAVHQFPEDRYFPFSPDSTRKGTNTPSFDRIISIELFEHMKNYDKLLAKLSTWLSSSGKLFVHIFAHKTDPYEMTEGWMAEHFFSNGNMPSADLLLFFQSSMKLKEMWYVNGAHYAKTCEVSSRVEI